MSFAHLSTASQVGHDSKKTYTPYDFHPMARGTAHSLQLTARYVSLLHSLELSRPPPSPVSLDLTLLVLTTSLSLFLLPLSSCLPLPPSSFFVLFMLLVSIRPTCRPCTSLFLPSSSTRRISFAQGDPQYLGRGSSSINLVWPATVAT